MLMSRAFASWIFGKVKDRTPSFSAAAILA